MSIFLSWMEGYPILDDKTRYLLEQYESWCSACGKSGNCENYHCQGLKEQIKIEFYRKADKRKMLLVRNKIFDIVTVRHIFHVVEDADQRLEEVKKEYYQNYTKLPGDEFLFFTGYQAVIDFLNKDKTATELQEDERIKFNEKSKKN